MSGSEGPAMLILWTLRTLPPKKVKNQYVVIQSGINLVALIYGVFWENKSL